MENSNPSLSTGTSQMETHETAIDQSGTNTTDKGTSLGESLLSPNPPNPSVTNSSALQFW